VAAARGQTLREHLAGRRHQHEAQRAGAAQHIAVGALERRAGQNHRPALLPRLRQQIGQRGQPAGTVVVGERHAGAHARDVLRRVMAVSLDELGAHRVRQRLAEAALAAAADAHDNHLQRLHSCEVTGWAAPRRPGAEA